jgi:hypothetical protein
MRVSFLGGAVGFLELANREFLDIDIVISHDIEHWEIGNQLAGPFGP